MKNRSYLLMMFLLLTGCVSPPEQRPEALLQGERFLAMGVHAFRADDYANAASHFTHALTHYHGLDHRPGILGSRLNLAETALAVGSYDAAARHLEAAERLAEAEGAGDAQRRIALLRSTLALKLGQHDEAVAVLEPLLAQASRDAVTQSALANRAAAALARTDADAGEWVARFAAAVDRDNASLLARLLRLQAELALRSGEVAQAEGLLQQALDLYKTVPARAATAATLEEWAALLAGQRQWDAAEEKLLRALNIRLWLLDRAATTADLRRLAALNTEAGRPERARSLTRWAAITAGTDPINWTELKRELLPY